MESLVVQNKFSNCLICNGIIGWIECPTGGWWAHINHPADNHDAAPPNMVERKIMETEIYRVVIEYCGENLKDITDFADYILEISNADYNMCPNYLVIEEQDVTWKEVYSV